MRRPRRWHRLRQAPALLLLGLLVAGCSGDDGDAGDRFTDGSFEGGPTATPSAGPGRGEVVFGPRFVAGPDLFPGAVAQSQATASADGESIAAPTTCGVADQLGSVLGRASQAESAGVKLEAVEEVDAPTSVYVVDVVLDASGQATEAVELAAQAPQTCATGGVTALPAAGLPQGTTGFVAFDGRAATALVPGGRSVLLVSWQNAGEPVPLDRFAQLVTDAVAQEASCVTSDQDDYCRPPGVPRAPLG